MTLKVRLPEALPKSEFRLSEPTPEPCAIVVFGATGDLTHRKLLPALFQLHAQGLLPPRTYLLGSGRTRLSGEAFRRKARGALPSNDGRGLRAFLNRLHYLPGDATDPADYQALKAALRKLDRDCGTRCRRLFFLATAPALYPVIVAQLGKADLARSPEPGWTRIMVEKPFGTDLASAKKLNAQMGRLFREEQIYRIDHYLGKETVQNIPVFRFANSLFEPVWNRNHIDHVQILVAEELGVEHRAGYYDKSGVLRDMFQNHLMQLLTLIAMEPPTRFEADALRDRKADVLRSIRPFEAAQLGRDLVLGQYGAGTIFGKRVPSYRQEEGVPPDSTTPTYAAMRLELANWRWQGVPFYLRSGKRLGRRVTQITVRFKHVPTSIFQPLLAHQLNANTLRLRIQPDEGISLSFEAKHPGPKLWLSTVTMDFDYQTSFGATAGESYARLFLDAMLGDQTLFGRADALEQSWSILDPMLRRCERLAAKDLCFYPAGSWGPAEAEILIAREKREWDFPYE